jgi:hypothetical protein
MLDPATGSRVLTLHPSFFVGRIYQRELLPLRHSDVNAAHTGTIPVSGPKTRWWLPPLCATTTLLHSGFGIGARRVC